MSTSRTPALQDFYGLDKTARDAVGEQARRERAREELAAYAITPERARELQEGWRA